MNISLIQKAREIKDWLEIFQTSLVIKCFNVEIKYEEAAIIVAVFFGLECFRRYCVKDESDVKDLFRNIAQERQNYLSLLELQRGEKQ